MNPQEAGAPFVIKDIQTLRVYSNTLRSQIVEILAGEALPARQIASRLGIPSHKIYYHLNLLEKHGFIYVIETRTVANMIEKTYATRAANIMIEQGLINFHTGEGREALQDSFLAFIDATREDLRRSILARASLGDDLQEAPKSAFFTREHSAIPVGRIKEFQQRLMDLVNDFNQTNHENSQQEECCPYSLTIALYPSFYYSPDQESESRA